MSVSQQEFHMWLVLRWAWEGREHRARTIPMPESQDYTNARAGVQSQDWAQHCARPPAAPSSLFHFPANLSSYSHGTPGFHAWHKWHMFPHLLWPVPKDCPSCWGLLEDRSTLAVPPSPGSISCASLGTPQSWNSPETVGRPLLLYQNS